MLLYIYTNDICAFILRPFSYLDVGNILAMFGGKELTHPVYFGIKIQKIQENRADSRSYS